MCLLTHGIYRIHVHICIYGQEHRYHAAVDTNNDVEAMNKALKYNYLPKLREEHHIILTSFSS